MKVKIGSLEITVETLDELDGLVNRYGGHVDNAPETSGDKKPSHPAKAPTGTGAADAVVLKKLIEAGTSGVPTNTLGELLGKRGKGARGALRKWSKRIGLNSDDNLDTFEDCRSGTKRGIRLKSSFLDVAKSLPSHQ